jgi:hypothetical protein
MRRNSPSMVFMQLEIMLHQETETSCPLPRRVRNRTTTKAYAVVASQMAKYLGKALNKTTSTSELVAQPGFKWKDKGSMVFIGDKNVRRNISQMK